MSAATDLAGTHDDPLVTSSPLSRSGSRAVHLPPAHAAATVRQLCAWVLPRTAALLEIREGGVGITLPDGSPLPPDTWALRFGLAAAPDLPDCFRDHRGDPPQLLFVQGALWLRFPLHTLFVTARREASVRHALEEAKPPRLDARGLPRPWVEALPPTQTLGALSASASAAIDREADVQRVAEGGALPSAAGVAPADRQTPLDPGDDASIQQALWALCARAGFGKVPLQVVRGTEPQDGFVAGQIVLAPSGPQRVRLVIDANSDAAEVWATLLHELAHALSPHSGHSSDFQTKMLHLAAAVFGEAALAGARLHLGSRFATVDAWLAVCIRAALRGAPPPLPEQGDEGGLSRVVSRIQKLRALARRHPGTPEATSACAKANDLLVRWDLGSYRVRLDAGIDDQMCDRWIDVGKGAVWRRQLGFLVSRVCGVFAISREEKGWMHFFGTHADVVTAEWFFGIWREHIERTCEAHLAALRARRAAGHPIPNLRTERTSFCDSAVQGIRAKILPDLADELDDIRARHSRAEQLAEREHDLRGMGWSSFHDRGSRFNADGLSAGAAAPMGRGVGGPAGVAGLLK